jgi:hypothetical protein
LILGGLFAFYRSLFFAAHPVKGIDFARKCAGDGVSKIRRMFSDRCNIQAIATCSRDLPSRSATADSTPDCSGKIAQRRLVPTTANTHRAEGLRCLSRAAAVQPYADG